MTTKIHYKAGEIHAVNVDENTVALVMPVDYAATVRDLIGHGVIGDSRTSRRKYAGMVWAALNGLQDFPAANRTDMDDGRVGFKANEAVKT